MIDIQWNPITSTPELDVPGYTYHRHAAAPGHLRPLATRRACEHCQGTGRTWDRWRTYSAPCAFCRGSGRER